MTQLVRVKLIHPKAKIPTYAKDGDSGADLYAVEGYFIFPGQTILLRTGVAIELPAGYEIQIRPRSNFSKRGIVTAFGTVDCGYRGELGVILFNTDPKMPVQIEPGDRIAQAVVVPVVQAKFEAVADLSPSERGEAGWGSTGR